MSTFNKRNVAPISVTTKTNAVTFEGAPSFKLDALMELYQTVVTTMFGSSKFYETGDERTKRIRRLVRRNVESGNAEFVAKLAVYTRERMNLRAVPIFLTVTLAQALRENSNTEFKDMRRLVCRVIQRADEIREMLAAAESVFGSSTNNKLFKRQCPRAIFKGISDACNKFDAYQFKKWSGGKGSIKFSDVFRVVHPVPKDNDQSDIFKMIMDDALPAIDTWETKIAGEGSTTENWQIIADNPKTGYMAKLRNLRNFVKNNVNLTNVINHLTNPVAVSKSKQLPFRFYSAYRELNGQNSYSQYGNENENVLAPAELLTALEDAFEESIKNIPDLGDDVLIVVDQSGSMDSYISNKSTVLCKEISAILGAAVWRNQTVTHGKRAMVAGFATTSKIYNWSTRTPALTAAKEMLSNDLGYSTNIHTAWEAAKSAGLSPSTIIVLSDMQMTGGDGYSRYDSIMNPEDFGVSSDNTLKISVNLQGYDTTPFAVNNGWYQIAGWSEKIFDLMEAMRNPGNSLEIIKTEITL